MRCNYVGFHRIKNGILCWCFSWKRRKCIPNVINTRKTLASAIIHHITIGKKQVINCGMRTEKERIWWIRLDSSFHNSQCGNSMLCHVKWDDHTERTVSFNNSMAISSLTRIVQLSSMPLHLMTAICQHIHIIISDNH